MGSTYGKVKSLNLDPFLLRDYVHVAGIGICHLAQAVKGDNEVLLKGVGDKGSNLEVKHMIEMVTM